MRLLHVFAKYGKIVINGSHKFEIDQGLVEWSVSCSLAKTKCCSMNYICTCFNGGNVVRNSQSTILMAMPIDFDISTVIASIFDDLFINEIEQFLDTVWCNVATGIANANSTNTKFHGTLIDFLDIFRIGASCIFCNKHHRHIVFNCKGDSSFHC